MMKGKFTFRCLCVSILILSGLPSKAKVWRVNNNIGVVADFTQLQDAISNAAVLPGDTIYLEPSITSYGTSTLNKRLVIIGPGYFLSGVDGNPDLQANPNTSIVNLYIDSTAKGSLLSGIQLTAYLSISADNLRIERCLLNLIAWGAANPSNIISDLTLTKCVLLGFNFNAYTDNMQITNCMVEAVINHQNGTNLLIRNNIFNRTTVQVTNTYFSNNIFWECALYPTSCTFKYNIATNDLLPTGNNNQNWVSFANLFVGGNSRDGKFILSQNSVAKNAGEPINGITPDCGAFGTADPYRLSGIPPIPTIYQLAAPTSVPSSATNMSITVSTRSNN